MLSRFNNPRLRKNPVFVFWSVFTAVFLVTLATVTAITFMLPDTYASNTRIKLEPNGGEIASAHASQQYDDLGFLPTAFEMIQSQVVLSNVVNALNLNVVWGKKYFSGDVLKTTECMDLLRKRMELQNVRNTRIISITVYSEDRDECALLANAIAEYYSEYRHALIRDRDSRALVVLQDRCQQQELEIDQLKADENALAQKYDIHETTGPYWDKKQKLEQAIDFQRALQAKLEIEKMDIPFLPSVQSLVEVVEPAKPAVYPVKPNKALNITLGAVAGIFLGACAGTIAALKAA